MDENRVNPPVPAFRQEGERWGLVLGGGGAKGCYHVGVWQAMNEEGIAFDAVSGTSIGALVGIFYPGNNIEPVTDFVMNMEPENIAQDLPHLPVTLKQKVQGTRTILQFVIRYFDSKMDITPLRTHFESMFDYDSFAASPVKYACMTFNDTKKQARPFFKGEITPENAETVVMASSACYPAFPKVLYEGDEYTDGMFADNVPIELLEQILPDASWSVVVDLHDPGEPLPPALGEKMFYIQPLLQLGNPLDFSREHAEKLYAQGYLETKKYLGRYPGYLYTFTESDRPVIRIVEDYLGRQITQMHIVLPKIDNLAERVLHTVLGYTPASLPVSQGADPYEFGKLVEALALSARISPVALYDYRQFLKLVLDTLEENSPLHSTPEEFRLISLIGNVKREETPNLLFRILKQNHGRFPEKIESMKEWFPVSYTLAVIRYCLDLLYEQFKPHSPASASGKDDHGIQSGRREKEDPAASQEEGSREGKKPETMQARQDLPFADASHPGGSASEPEPADFLPAIPADALEK